MVDVIAHRGSGVGRTENTLKGLQQAVIWGANGVEFDVRCTKDGELVVIHDENLERTTDGSGLVGQLSLSELKRLDAGEGEQVPTLKEVFDLFGRETTLTLHIEMKVPNAERQVLRIIEEVGLMDRVVISSFLPSVLKTLHELDKNVITAYLFHHNESPILTAQRLGCSGLHPLFASVTRDLVDTARREGLFVNPWTVNFEEEMRRLIGLGVDGIITDDPPLLIALLRSKGG